MIPKIKTALLFLSFFFIALTSNGQRIRHYNLADLLNENKLDTSAGQQVHIVSDAQYKGISAKGIVWLKGVNFKDGTIDVDLRGKNVFLQSFMGIAFHAKDTGKYDVIYFRPFRFRIADTPTRKWSIQYMSIPNYDYDKLRKEHPGVYENDINPAPQPEDWLHATIVIKKGWATVYVNHAANPSLKVKLIDDTLAEGKIGLWSSPGSLSSDFANLGISE
jgi:hypothetical protein